MNIKYWSLNPLNRELESFIYIEERNRKQPRMSGLGSSRIRVYFIEVSQEYKSLYYTGTSILFARFWKIGLERYCKKSFESTSYQFSRAVCVCLDPLDLFPGGL